MNIRYDREPSMRQGQQNNNNNNKRMRGRNRKGPNPLTRSYESNGPDVKIRGTALHIAEKYVALARDAQSSGDRVAAESYLQHAEHYYRIVAAAQAQLPQPQPIYRSDEEGEDDFDERGSAQGDRFSQSDRFSDRFSQRDGEPAYGVDAPQPYVNGSNGQPHGGYNGAPRPEQQQAAPQPQGFAGDGEGEEEDGANAAAGGEQGQFRTRRRRQNRGRYRRQDGEGGQGQPGAQGQGPQPVADREPSFSED